MKLAIHEFVELSEIRSHSIRNRAAQSRCEFSLQYLAFVDEYEAGYLSFDNRNQIGVGIIYEIFVLEGFRRQGVGNALLAFGENLAKEVGCDRVVLTPKPFDGTVAKEALVSWYERHGYRRVGSGETGEMEKLVA